jgi:quercetin dioxygenase-like cupin family protein
MRFYKVCLIICLFFVPSLVNAGEYDGGVQSKVILKAATTGNGAPIAYLKTDQPEITAMTVEVSPGAQTGWHSHSVPVYAYVISGCLTVNIEGNISRKFNAGDVIIEVVNTRHNGINEGATPVKLVVFYTGAKDIPNVLKTAAP